MIKISNVQTFGFDGAIRGMRNPYMSHEKSDSEYISNCRECLIDSYANNMCSDVMDDDCCPKCFEIGIADMALCKKLIKAGPEHRKFLRMIHVQADVTAPRYWWAEMDKYKYIEANSSSTMHLITKRELTLEDFSTDGAYDFEWRKSVITALNSIIRSCNATNDKEAKGGIFRSLKQLLPESYNQLRTIDTNYECLLSIYHQRKNHRLTEWKEFCMWIASLPYTSDFLEAVK